MAAQTVIPCFSWNTKGPAKAVLICLHGLGLHGGTYRLLGERMARRGIATYALDMRGFGKWQQTESCILNFPACLEDIRVKVEQLREQHPGLPIFVLGESLGGAVSLRYACEYPDSINGLVLCAPARALTDHIGEALLLLLTFLVRPRRKICIADSVFRYCGNVLALEELDPEVRFEFAPRELFHLGGFLLESTRGLSRLPNNLPVLMLQGLGDALVKPRATLELFEKIPTNDKELAVIGDAQHLILQHRFVPRKALALVENWIEEHLPKRSERRRAA